MRHPGALSSWARVPFAEFSERMECYIAELKSAPLAQGFDEVFYPGEIEARNDLRNRADGLVIRPGGKALAFVPAPKKLSRRSP